MCLYTLCFVAYPLNVRSTMEIRRSHLCDFFLVFPFLYHFLTRYCVVNKICQQQQQQQQNAYARTHVGLHPHVRGPAPASATACAPTCAPHAYIHASSRVYASARTRNQTHTRARTRTHMKTLKHTPIFAHMHPHMRLQIRAHIFLQCRSSTTLFLSQISDYLESFCRHKPQTTVVKKRHLITCRASVVL